jgi:hypothetical protein
MTLVEILALALFAVAAYVFWDSLKAREAANAAMRDACRQEGLLFLDDTVALSSLWFARDERGRLRISRTFDFEYSDTGRNRCKGQLRMLGDDAWVVDLSARSAAESETLH